MCVILSQRFASVTDVLLKAAAVDDFKSSEISSRVEYGKTSVVVGSVLPNQCEVRRTKKEANEIKFQRNYRIIRSRF